MRTFLTLCTTLIGTLALTIGLSSPAQSEVIHLRNNVHAKVPENDMVGRQRVNNARTHVTFRTELRDIRPGKRVRARLVYAPGDGKLTYALRIARVDGVTRRTLWTVNDDTGIEDRRIPCTGIEGGADNASNTIWGRVPQRCFPTNARSASVKLITGYWNFNDGDWTGYRRVQRG